MTLQTIDIQEEIATSPEWESYVEEREAEQEGGDVRSLARDKEVALGVLVSYEEGDWDESGLWISSYIPIREMSLEEYVARNGFSPVYPFLYLVRLVGPRIN